MASASPLKRSLTGRNVQLTLALLKPDICAKPDLPPRIYEAIKSNNLDIVTKRNVLWTLEEAGQFYAEHKGKFFYERLCGYMTRYKKKGYFFAKTGLFLPVECCCSGPFQALVLSSPDAIKGWRALIGPTHPVRYAVIAKYLIVCCCC